MNTPHDTTSQVAEGRDAKGRFTKGNKGGPGNPFARKVAELRQALVNFVTEDDMKHVAFVLKERAMGGDLAAIKLLFQYVLGKPTQTVDPDRLDVDEWQKMQEQARPAEEMSTVMGRLPADLACDMTRIAWPCEVERGFGAPMLAGLSAMDERDTAREASAKETAGEKPAARTVEQRPMANGGNGQRVETEEREACGPSINGEWLAWLTGLLHQARTRSGERSPDKGDSPSANGGNGRAGRASG